MADIPPSLLNAEILAEDIYSCWRELMITDKVNGASSWPVWIKMSEDWKRTLIEACKMSVTSTLRKLYEKGFDFDFPDQEPEALKLADNQIARRCYICDIPTQTGGEIPVCYWCSKRTW